jgi:hypothetical protein
MNSLEKHARHPNWSECPSCGKWFTCDSAFDRHLGPIPEQGRPKCKPPSEVRKGSDSLIYDEAKGAWRWDAEYPVERLRQRPVAVSGAA